MGEERFLIVRLGSLGDVLHALPAVHTLRAAHPAAKIDWVIESRWRALLDGNPDINDVLELDRASWSRLRATVRKLRAAGYTAAIDLQGLYKSAVLARLSGARQRIGFDRRYARESGAALFYSERIVPRGRHVIEHNLSLAAAAGAERIALDAARFPLSANPQAAEEIRQQLRARGVGEYFVMSPGGGWGSKCWPAERYGQLHRRLLEAPAFAGLRGVVNFGPGEQELAETARRAAGQPEPVVMPLALPQLVALIRGARFFVGGDTGPLHLAVALGIPVVALFGPTDPARNGPIHPVDIVVRNAGAEDTSYKRERMPAPSMLSISVDQAADAICRRMGVRA
jgi:lipopolysaccharide heptosyltransferase I